MGFIAIRVNPRVGLVCGVGSVRAGSGLCVRVDARVGVIVGGGMRVAITAQSVLDFVQEVGHVGQRCE